MSRSVLFTGALLLLGACSKPDGSSSGAAPSGVQITITPVKEPAEFEKLGDAVAACTMKTGTEYGIDPRCMELRAYEAGRTALPTDADRHKIDAAVAPKLLASKAGPVRALGATYLSLISGADAASSELIVDAMEKETDPAVLAHMVRSAGPAAEKSEKVAAAIIKAAGHADRSVRFHATTILENPNLAGATEKILELAEKDPDREVKNLACSNLGRHGDKAFALLEKLTSDTTSPTFGACFVGLVRQWASPPKFDTESEKAYKLTLKRIAQKPHGEQAPAFTGLTLIARLAEDTPEATAWKQKHTWFKQEPLVKVLGEVVTDPASGHASRFGALDAAIKQGATKAQLQAWRKSFGDKPPEAFVSIATRLDNAINDAKK